jgi:hypothetical protein
MPYKKDYRCLLLDRTEYINALWVKLQDLLVSNLQFAIMYVFRRNQSNQILLALQGTHR